MGDLDVVAAAAAEGRREVLDKQPFDGPLHVRFGDAVHVLGGGLAAAMRVEAD